MNTNLNNLLKGLADVRTRQILLTKFSKETESIYENSYAYAVCKSIYPIFHEERFQEEDAEVYKLNLPFYETYNLSESVVREFAEYLDKNWLEKKYFTFYQLEEHYRYSWGGKENRSDMINCLRYFYLQGIFDKPFWSTLLKPMEYPTEADRIVKPFDKNELRQY